MNKRKLYETFIARADVARDAGHHLEASWYAGAILEDRLRSLLQRSGGEVKTAADKSAEEAARAARKKLAPATRKKPEPIRTLGAKLAVLRARAKTDKLLKANLCEGRLAAWIDSRNALVHAMADGSADATQIDERAAWLAVEGNALVRLTSAAAQRVKRHRSQVSA